MIIGKVVLGVFFVAATSGIAEAGHLRQLDAPDKSDRLCDSYELYSKCLHDTKRINGREVGECAVIQQGDLINHKSLVVQKDENGAPKEVGSLQKICSVMNGGVNLATGAAIVELDGHTSTFMIQGVIGTAEPHGVADLAIVGSVGYVKNALGTLRIDFNNTVPPFGHPVTLTVCGGYVEDE